MTFRADTLTEALAMLATELAEHGEGSPEPRYPAIIFEGVTVNVRAFVADTTPPDIKRSRFPDADLPQLVDDVCELLTVARQTGAGIVSVNAGLGWGNVTGLDVRWGVA